jgi:hypothetical protein
MNTVQLMDMCETKIASLESELKRINQSIIDDGMNDELALELAKNRISLEYAKKEYDALNVQLDDELKYFESKAFKNAVKELAILEKQADEFKALALSLADDVLTEIENWEMAVQKHRQDARSARVDVKDLLMSEMGVIGSIITLKMSMQAWKRDAKLRESMNIR